VHAHLARVVGQDLVAVVSLHPERGVLQRLHDSPFEQDGLLLGVGIGIGQFGIGIRQFGYPPGTVADR
jgi:hypothetical protein